MYKHALKEHHENIHEVSYKWDVNRTFMKPLKRQLYEAKCIDEMEEQI